MYYYHNRFITDFLFATRRFCFHPSYLCRLLASVFPFPRHHVSPTYLLFRSVLISLSFRPFLSSVWVMVGSSARDYCLGMVCGKTYYCSDDGGFLRCLLILIF